MPLYQIVILAVVQSLTEFLPVSSTAHLALAPWLFGWQDPGLLYDIALHLGTLLALLAYFFRDWVQLIGQGFGLRVGHDEELGRNPRLIWFLAVATIPVAVAGFLLEHKAESEWRSPLVIGTMLIVVGVLIWVADRAAGLRKDLAKVSFLDSVLIGLSQAVAIIPGTSRSGITISTGLFRGLDRQAAARFSFLLSTPALGGAALDALWKLKKAGGIAPDMRLAFFLGVVLSAITGAIVIAFFMRFLRRHTLRFFVYYRIIFGIIIIALAVFYRQPAG